MKLKSLLKESSLKVLDRKFGEPLPTLEDTTKAYKLKKEQEVKEPVKEDIEDFLAVVDTEDLSNIVSGNRGINKLIDKKAEEINGLADDMRREVLDNLRGPEYKNQVREWKKLYKEINEQTRAAQGEIRDALNELDKLGKKYAKWVESIKKVKK